MSKEHIFGLDSLRAIAALVVVLSHIELIKQTNNIPSCFTYMPSGNIGVVLFFVISGFLITTLLLQEKTKNKTISIKKFYTRRILRIWPLYYFVLIISSVIFSYHPQINTLVLCLTILPNIAHTMNYGWAVSPQIWSIGVEEQFYLIWPALIKFIRSRLLLILILIILIYTFLPHILLFIIKRTNLADSTIPKIINGIYFSTKFNCLALGGLLAYLVQHKSKIITVIRNKYLSILFILIPFILWGFNFEFSYFTSEIFALLFCLLIANIINKKHYFFDNKILSFLGKISYGIYMYHWIIISLLIKWFLPLFKNKYFYTNIFIYVLVLFFTILIATISYYTIERYFLNLKKRFEIV